MIGEMLASARASSTPLRSLVVTFDPLPFEVLHPGAPPSRLTDIEERLDLLATSGIDAVCVVEFTKELAALPPLEFLELLGERYTIRQIWCGRDFAFGHNREGSVDFLRAHAAALGFEVHAVDRIDLDGKRLGSRDARRLITDGRVEEASAVLGHWPSVSGPVVDGAKRGRQLGFPTANIQVPPYKLIPREGIYAGYATLSASGSDPAVRQPSAISVGYNPTFGANPLSVEAFIIDFDREILGERLTLEFAHRLRDELKFETVEDLVTQMQADVADARKLLA